MSSSSPVHWSRWSPSILAWTQSGWALLAARSSQWRRNGSKVGQVVRRLPAALLDLGNSFEDNGRKRKRKADAVCFYEPKSKVQILSKDDKFQVKLDTSNYQPDEITVKVINDRIAISAKHESRGDDVYEYHEMTRSFDLPEGVDPATVVSRLNTSGQLTIEAPMKPQKEAIQGRVIPVEMSKDSPKKDASENKKRLSNGKECE
ncbi:hypothetical protein TNCV_4136561 [Trichonephila clavipes]|nr:hypothetical protein TNCV_4136561 [Trichonephila clavipes]